MLRPLAHTHPAGLFSVVSASFPCPSRATAPHSSFQPWLRRPRSASGKLLSRSVCALSRHFHLAATSPDFLRPLPQSPEEASAAVSLRKGKARSPEAFTSPAMPATPLPSPRPCARQLNLALSQGIQLGQEKSGIPAPPSPQDLTLSLLPQARNPQPLPSFPAGVPKGHHHAELSSWDTVQVSGWHLTWSQGFC